MQMVLLLAFRYAFLSLGDGIKCEPCTECSLETFYTRPYFSLPLSQSLWKLILFYFKGFKEGVKVLEYLEGGAGFQSGFSLSLFTVPILSAQLLFTFGTQMKRASCVCHSL